MQKYLFQKRGIFSLQVMMVIVSILAMLSFSCSTKGAIEVQKRVPIGKCTPIPQGDGWVNLFSPEYQTKWENASNDDKKAGFEFLPDNTLHIPGSKGGSS